jgi:GNAT superfamily N-acetyltransferase
MKTRNKFDDFLFRKVDLKKDKTLLIDLECELNYANESYLRERFDFAEYRQRWFSHGRPKIIFDSFKEVLKDKRTICEFLETTAGEKVAFFMVTFADLKGFDLVSAFLEDIYVFEKYRKRGIGSFLLKKIEARAKSAGAEFIRDGTSFLNKPSKKLHEKNGYYVYRFGFEKRL